MKKKSVAIVTLNGDANFGNRLQNYAVQEFLKKFDLSVCTLRIYKKRKSLLFKFFKIIVLPFFDYRYHYFCNFNKNVKTRYCLTSSRKNYDYYFTGSDQVWNPYWIWEEMFLDFVPPNKRNSISASIGTEFIPQDKQQFFFEQLKDFNNISVRETKAKEIIEDLTGRTDVEVLLDPTMFLTQTEWKSVMKKPKQIKSNEKYILNYFLGGLSDSNKQEIEKFAVQKECKIINLLDKNDPFYISGPSEFLWLIKNALLICTDSFHSSVFSILFEKPFVYFDRIDIVGEQAMNSRLETLFLKFQLDTRNFNGHLTDDCLNVDYSYCKEVLEEERLKATNFIKNCLKE